MVNEKGAIESELERIISLILKSKGKECVIADIDEIHSFRLEVELIQILTRVYKMKGIIICVSRPAGYLQKALAQRGLQTEELYFIDTIKCLSGALDEQEVASWVKNTSLLGSPFDVNAIIKMLKARVKKIKASEHFIILDSIVPIVLYWDPDKIEEFIGLLKKLPKEYGSKVIITIPKTAKEVMR
ncbi:MAG: hypothetical protein QME47_06075 [Candidatus Thermoplasmatota archaeon]|nr:hypothetical protein [Candidatus Thermoplasmatota archaeon]